MASSAMNLASALWKVAWAFASIVTSPAFQTIVWLVSANPWLAIWALFGANLISGLWGGGSLLWWILKLWGMAGLWAWWIWAWASIAWATAWIGGWLWAMGTAWAAILAVNPELWIPAAIAAWALVAWRAIVGGQWAAQDDKWWKPWVDDVMDNYMTRQRLIKEMPDVSQDDSTKPTSFADQAIQALWKATFSPSINVTVNLDGSGNVINSSASLSSSGNATKGQFTSVPSINMPSYFQ